MRIVTLAILVACGVGAWGTIASACGDKFVRIGRSVRSGKYVAVHASSILVYAPRNSAPARVDLAPVLKAAGHSPVVITDAGALSAAIASGKYQLVLAGLPDAQRIAALAATSPSGPEIMPVLINGTKADHASVRTMGTGLIDLPSDHKNQALAEIDHRLELRLDRRAGKRP